MTDGGQGGRPRRAPAGTPAAGAPSLEERLARAHPQVRDLLLEGDRPPPDDVGEARAAYRLITELRTGPREPVAEVRDEDAGGVAVRLYVPAVERGSDAGRPGGGGAGARPRDDAPHAGRDGAGIDQGVGALDPPGPRAALPALLYLHGGGWVVGDLDGVDALCRALANRVQAIVVSADSRLAPEHRFPAGLDDAGTVLAWMRDRASSLGAAPDRLAVGGDSAGGNLAAALARRARDHSDPSHPALRAQLLVYPALDGALATASAVELAEGYVLTRDQMRWYWDAYAPEGAARTPDASPLRAPDLAGLPPR